MSYANIDCIRLSPSKRKSTILDYADDVKCDYSDSPSQQKTENEIYHYNELYVDGVCYKHCQINEREDKSIQHKSNQQKIKTSRKSITILSASTIHHQRPTSFNGLKRSLSSPSLSSYNLLNGTNTKNDSFGDNIKSVDCKNLPDLMELYKQIPALRLNIENAARHNKLPINNKSNSYILCQHKSNCFKHAVISGFFRTFAASYVFKTSLSLFQNALFGKLINFNDGMRNMINMTKFRSICTNQDNLLFAQFLGLMSLSYKSILCLLRRYFKNDDIAYKSIAGFISGFWMILDNPRRQKLYAMNGIIRAISDAIRLAVFYNKLPIIPGFNLGLFTMSQLIILNAAFWRPTTVHPTLYKFLLKLGNMEHKKIEILRQGCKTKKFVECYPSLHEDKSCLVHNTKDFVLSFKKASIIYLAVHFLPMLLFEPRKVFSNPTKYFKKNIKNTLVSCLFVSSYNFMVKSNICFFRNIFKMDYWWTAIFCSIFAGLTLLIEHIKRRPELTLYCIPRSIEIIMRLFTKQKSPKIYKFLRSKYLRVISFQICIALWMTIRSIPKGIEKSNTLNMTIMKLIFGTKN